MTKTDRTWYVYLIRCSDDSFYTGISTDVNRRFKEHTATFSKQQKKGAKYFRSRKPLYISYIESCIDRSAASKREAEIKKLSKQSKARLANQLDSPNITKLGL